MAEYSGNTKFVCNDLRGGGVTSGDCARFRRLGKGGAMLRSPLQTLNFNPGAGMHKSALIMLFASSMNTASAEEVTAQAPSPQSAKIIAIERSLLLQPRQAPPACDDQNCGFRFLDESWKRGILPPGFKASGANAFQVENAGSVIRERAGAAETEKLYEASPPKLTFKFLGMDCELGTFTAGGKQEGGTRCPF